MTKDLRTGREQLELSARMLKEQNIEIEEKRHYIEFVLKSVSAGVVTLDANGMVQVSATDSSSGSTESVAICLDAWSAAWSAMAGR